MSAQWPEWRLDRLRQLWKEGKTASWIARALGGGTTRHSVVGKAHRLGLVGRPSPIKRSADNNGERRPPRKRKPKASDRELEAARRRTAKIKAKRVEKIQHALERAEPVPPPAPNLNMPGFGCRFPIGDPHERDFRFCQAKPVIAGKPYCAEHCRQAYVGLSRGFSDN